MQQIKFADLVNQIQRLSTEEKEELFKLLQKYMFEERRNAIFDAYQETRVLEESLEFSSDIQVLKKRLNV